MILPISEKQFDDGVDKHNDMICRAKTIQDIENIHPYHQVLLIQARRRGLQQLTSTMIQHFWEKKTELRFNKKD